MRPPLEEQSATTTVIPMRTCTKCKETKPLTEFHRKSASRTGYRAECKACALAREKQRREEKRRREGRESRWEQPQHYSARTIKRCWQCGQLKPIEEFARRSSSRDGRDYRCKECNRKACAEWKTRNTARLVWYRQMTKEERAAYMRAWRAANRERLENYRRQRKAYQRITQQVRDAVHQGKIVKPDACENCGEPTPKELLHGHHEDYSKPLDVIWLCPICHAQRHVNGSPWREYNATSA